MRRRRRAIGLGVALRRSCSSPLGSGAAIPAADQRPLAADIGIVPLAGADELHVVRWSRRPRRAAARATGRSSRPAGRNSASTLCPDLTALATWRTGRAWRRHRRAGRSPAPKPARRRRETALANGALGDPAIGRLRDELGEITLALRQGERDDARHVASGEEAQQINAVARDLLVAGKGDHRHAALARDRRGGRPPPARIAGPMISSAPSCSALSAARARAVRRALGVLRNERDVGIVEIEQRNWAACLSALATAGVEPDAVMGSSSATLTVPVEPVMPGAGPPPPPPGAPQDAASAATSTAASISLTAPR